MECGHWQATWFDGRQRAGAARKERSGGLRRRIAGTTVIIGARPAPPAPWLAP
jgi:hypothetical protein